MTKFQLQKFLRLRLSIGYLGESEQDGWWQTSFFNHSSQIYLQPIFTKTSGLAKYQGVKEAAKQVHDEYIGKGRVLHLFRLPEEIEQELHRLLLSEDATARLASDLLNRETALTKIKEVAEQDGLLQEGPISVGQFEATQISALLKLTAQYYVRAFEAKTKVFPYFFN